MYIILVTRQVHLFMKARFVKHDIQEIYDVKRIFIIYLILKPFSLFQMFEISINNQLNKY